MVIERPFYRACCDTFEIIAKALIVLAVFAVLFPAYAQDTVPKQTVDMYRCTDNTGNWERFPAYQTKSECEAFYVGYAPQFSTTGYTTSVFKDWYVYGSYNRKTWFWQNPYGSGYMNLYFSNSPIDGEACPDSHPVDNGDGTCSKTEEQEQCEAKQGEKFSQHGQYPASGYACYGGCVAATTGVSVVLKDNNSYMTLKYTGATCTGETDGAPISEDGGEPAEPEPESPTSCNAEATSSCSAQGLYAVGVGVVNGECSYSCTSNPVTEDNTNDPYGDDDGDGIPNEDDPDHPLNGDDDGDGIPNGDDPDFSGGGWGDSNPTGDSDGDGIPNEDDPDHPLNGDDDGDGIPNGDDPDFSGGGWGSGVGTGESGTDLTGVESRLDRLILSSVANNEWAEKAIEAQVQNSAITEQLRSETGENFDDLKDFLGTELTDEEITASARSGFDAGINSATAEETSALVASLRQEAGLTEATGAEIIPTHTINASDYEGDYTGFVASADMCPEPYQITLWGKQYQLEYSRLCEVLEALKPLLVFLAYLSAVYIVFFRSKE